ncbi:DUF11 domain-containing protein, partial [Flavobacteriaceae bacterium F08102]|nr:DUF11 domain-containing protein [Flavobacteriaceae bacterium F08102]
PDYLDLDSDNEGGNDTLEAGITLSNADTDNDGLDNSTDATNGYLDSGGTIDDPLANPVALPDLDTDAATGGDVDFRDAVSLADLSLKKVVSNASPAVGDEITFTITIVNNGSAPTTDIVMLDSIPAGLSYTHPNFNITEGSVSYNSGTRKLEWDLGGYILEVNHSVTLTYTVSVIVCGEFVNQAEIINSALSDPDSTPNNGK